MLTTNKRSLFGDMQQSLLAFIDFFSRLGLGFLSMLWVPIFSLVDAQTVVFGVLKHALQTGSVSIAVHDTPSKVAKVHNFGAAGTGHAAQIEVHSKRFFARVLLEEDVGFGESFHLGEWTTPDLQAVLHTLVENQFNDSKIPLAGVGRFFNALRHAARQNTLVGSQENISEHYDESPEYFSLFLDPTLTYSCAIWEKADDTLEQAQLNKIHKILDNACIEKHHHILEIGTGWGALAIEAAKKYGCRVTSVTISREQLIYARNKIRRAGLEGQIEVMLQDYRTLVGQFDRIVSVEMMEAIGAEFLPTFFQSLDRILKPQGVISVQVITIPDHRYDAYRRQADYIQKFIFPGGHLPSLTALTAAMTKASPFFVEKLDNYSLHYAKTLRVWFDKFMANRSKISNLGYDDVFIRKQIYYLAYCEVGFATRTLNLLHLTITRERNMSLPGLPVAM